MRSMIYSNLIGLLLEEGDKSIKEMTQIAIDKFEFPEKYAQAIIELKLSEKMEREKIQKKREKYHITKMYGLKKTRENFLKWFKNAPDSYLNDHPYAKNLRLVLEDRAK